MDFDILDSLDDLGYSKHYKDDKEIKSIIEIGPKSIQFTQLIEWLSKELQALCKLDACVNSIEDSADASSFLLEVSSFLKELHCPYKELVTGSINERLSDVKSRLLLIDFLCTELQAARLLYHKSKKTNALEIQLDDSSVASSLSMVQDVLGIEASENDVMKTLFSEIEEKVSQAISKDPVLKKVLKPALKESLTEEQWNSLQNLFKDFMEDYCIRRQLLLTRVEVTVKSFKWGESSQGKESKIIQEYVNKRTRLSKVPSVKISDVIAARKSIFEVEKTSSAELVKNTQSSIKKFMMPPVPDRGGRPGEQKPAAEMPKWSKRSGGGGGGWKRDTKGNSGGDGHQFSRKKNKKHKEEEEAKGHFDAAGSY